jgi:shikimate kinase
MTTYSFPGATQAPYRNLILAGEMGIGKTEVARRIADHFGAPLRDIEAELESAAGMPLHEVRALYGEARVTNMETDMCRELTLQRGAVIAVHATTILNESNRRRLEEAGEVLVLTTALNELLRRLHVAKADRFHDVQERARTMIRLRQEWKVRDLPYPQLDTTRLTPDEVAAQVIAFWRATGEA